MAAAPIFSIEPFKALAPATRSSLLGQGLGSLGGLGNGFSGSLGKALGGGTGLDADRIAATSELILNQGIMEILGDGESGEGGGGGGGGIGGLNGLLLNSLLGGQGGLAGGLSAGLPGDLGALIKSYPGGVEGLVTALRQAAAASPADAAHAATAAQATAPTAPPAQPTLPAALEPAAPATPAATEIADTPGLARSSGIKAYGRVGRTGAPEGAAALGQPAALPQPDLFSSLLGRISARFESGGDPAAVGFDRTGGTSYGIYQLSSRSGTMDQFLGFLEHRRPDLAARLDAAGAANTGSTGGAMPAAWRSIAAKEPEAFAKLQHDFIGQHHFLPAAERIREATGLDLAQNPALAQVLWSTAVQHGPTGAASIVSGAAEAAGPLGAPGFAQNLVGEIYKRRAGQFASSDAPVQDAVRARLKEERDLALSLLRVGGMIDSEV